MGKFSLILRGTVILTPICRKLIGAEYFSKGYEAHDGPFNPTVRTSCDQDGHGTHTLSTAAGNCLDGASVLGMGEGTAKGGTPWARVASYKACWLPRKNGWCFDEGILAWLLRRRSTTV